MPPVSQLAKDTPRFRFVWFLVLGLLAQRLGWLRTFRQWVHSRASRQPPQRNVAPVSEGSGKGAYRGRQARQTASARGQSSEHQSNALPGATEREIGPQWHFGGSRRWIWMHDGSKENGWLEFCCNNILRTSLCDDGRGTWELRPNGNMCVTFGKCHHIIITLAPEVHGQAPMFELRERLMRNGTPLKQKRQIPTRGCLAR